jgi:hypothetical protein
MTEFQPKPQTPEQVADGLRDAFRQAMKDGVMDATPYLKQMTIKATELEPYQIIKDGDCIYYRGVKYQRVEKPKPIKLYDIIADWWDEIFTNGNPTGQNIETLVEQIEEWLPKEQSAAGSQNAYVECVVEGFNDCLTKIKSKLR